VPLDTTPEMARLHADVLRRAGPTRRLEMVFQMGQFLLSLSRRDQAWRPSLSQADAFLAVSACLDEAGVEFMVVGAVASGAHGYPRFTEGIDLVVRPTPSLPSPPASGWKVGLYPIEGSPVAVEAFSRRKPITFAEKAIPFATAEDVVLSKLEWDRITPLEQQIRDALSVAIMQADKLDRAYLRKWAPELGVSAKLDELLAEADRFLAG
jgi:hypothetical protein